MDYLNARSKQLGFDWELHYSDLLEYTPKRKYDAIVIMGVIEHMPDYARALEKLQLLLKPGGLAFLDGSASRKKYKRASFTVKHIYNGNHTYMVLHDFLQKLARTKLEAIEILDDRFSYFLTCQQWARNFERNRDFVIQRFGEFNYRRFRVYLWGTTHAFLTGRLGCYRMIIRNGDESTALPPI